MSDPRDDDRRNERDRGSVMVVAALALVALVLFAALAVDVGLAYSSRTQSQNAADSAAVVPSLNDRFGSMAFAFQRLIRS